MCVREREGVYVCIRLWCVCMSEGGRAESERTIETEGRGSDRESEAEGVKEREVEGVKERAR